MPQLDASICAYDVRPPGSIWPGKWRRWFLVILLLSALLSGCRQSSSAVADTTPEPTVGVIALGTPGTGTNVTGGLPANPTERQLVLWLPAFTGLANDGSAGAVLDAAFKQFEQAQPAVRLDIQVKAESGPADLLGYLQSTQQVAPSLLPDLILIDTQQLWQLADLGMIPPLTPEEYSFDTDYYPFVTDAVTYRTERLGIPYAADLIHTIYEPSQFDAAPATWDELLATYPTYLFPAGEGSGGDLSATLHYVGANGTLIEDSTTADDASLAALFGFLDEAQANGLIDARTTELPTFDATWRLYLNERPGLALVQTHNYLENLPSHQDIAFGPVPTQDGSATTLGTTWAFAVLTTDPERRATAIQLVDLLLTPEVLGPWSQLAHRVPSRRSSMAVWPQDNPYYAFLQTLASSAQAPPNGRAFAEFMRRLRVAQAGILRQELTVDQAIQTVRAGE